MYKLASPLVARKKQLEEQIAEKAAAEAARNEASSRPPLAEVLQQKIEENAKAQAAFQEALSSQESHYIKYISSLEEAKKTAENQIHQLQSRLEAEILLRTNAQNQNQRKIEEIQEQLKTAQNKLSQVAEEKSNLQHTYQAHLSVIEGLTKGKREGEESIARLTQLKNEYAAQIQSKDAEILAQEAVKSNLLDQQISLEKKNKELEKQIKSLSNAWKEKEKEYLEKIKTLENEAKQKDEVSQEFIYKSTQTILEVAGKVEGFNQEIRNRKLELDELNQYKATAASALHQNQETIKALENRNKELLNRVKNQEVLQENLNGNNQEIKRLKEENIELSTKCNEEIERKNKIEQDLVGIHEQLMMAHRTLSEKEGELRSFKGKEAKLKDDLAQKDLIENQLKELVQDVKGKYNAIQSELEKKEQEIKNLEEKEKISETLLNDRKSTILAIEKEKEIKIEEKQTLIDSLQEEKRKLEEGLRELPEIKSELEEAKQNALIDKERALESLHDIENRLMQAEEELNRRGQVISELQQYKQDHVAEMTSSFYERVRGVFNREHSIDFPELSGGSSNLVILQKNDGRTYLLVSGDEKVELVKVVDELTGNYKEVSLEIDQENNEAREALWDRFERSTVIELTDRNRGTQMMLNPTPESSPTSSALTILQQPSPAVPQRINLQRYVPNFLSLCIQQVVDQFNS